MVVCETFVQIERLNKQQEKKLVPLAEGPRKKGTNINLADDPLPASRKAVAACASGRLRDMYNRD